MAVGLVLLHSPLVGPGTWSELAPLLRARGYGVTAPDYSAVMQGPQPYYEKIISAAAMIRPKEPVVFVAHSGAGALIPALATKPGGQRSGAIFMDALLPHPGRAWFDTVSDTLKAHLRNVARDGHVPP